MALRPRGGSRRVYIEHRAWKVACGPVLQNSRRLTSRSLEKGLNATVGPGKLHLDLFCKTRQDALPAASRSHGKSREDWLRGASKRVYIQQSGLKSCSWTCSAKLAKIGPEEPQEGLTCNIRAWKVACGPALQNSPRCAPSSPEKQRQNSPSLALRSLEKSLNETLGHGKFHLGLFCKTRQDALPAALRSHGETRQDGPKELREWSKFNILAWKVACGAALQNSPRCAPSSLEK